MRVILNMERLKQIEMTMPGSVDKIVLNLAQATDTDMKRHFSRKSPSSPGRPPAVDTGNLKNSIVARPAGRGKAEVSIGAEYAIYLEYGTTRMAARPFLRPAVERISEKAKEIVKATLFEVL